MIRAPAPTVWDCVANCAVVALYFLAATTGTDREGDFAVRESLS
jgi:hypothetical protein